MVVIACTIPTRDFKTDDVSEALAIALLANHGLAHQYTLPHTTGSLLPPVPRGPKLERPKVNIGVSTEEWNLFTRRWEVFRTGSGIDDESAPSQLNAHHIRPRLPAHQSGRRIRPDIPSCILSF